MGGGSSAPAPPVLKAPKPVPLSQTFSQFLGQRGYFPSLSDFAGDVNQLFRSQLEEGLPGTLGAANQISTLVNQLLGGSIPADVQAQMQRQGAERAMALGVPATSEMAQNLQARDFGLTSMQLMQQGAAYTPGLMELSSFLSPQQVQNYLFSTGQLRGEQLKQASDDAAVANQNAMNKYNYDVAQSQSKGGMFGSIGGLVGGIGGAALGSVFPGIGTAAGASLGSALGGSIGSFASGGGFAPTAGAGAFGGLIGNAASGLFNSGGLSGAGQSLSPTAFSSLGQAYTMPTSTYFSPSSPSVMNPLNNFFVPQSRGSYGGQYPISVGGIQF